MESNECPQPAVVADSMSSPPHRSRFTCQSEPSYFPCVFPQIRSSTGDIPYEDQMRDSRMKIKCAIVAAVLATSITSAFAIAEDAYFISGLRRQTNAL